VLLVQLAGNYLAEKVEFTLDYELYAAPNYDNPD